MGAVAADVAGQHGANRHGRRRDVTGIGLPPRVSYRAFPISRSLLLPRTWRQASVAEGLHRSVGPRISQKAPGRSTETAISGGTCAFERISGQGRRVEVEHVETSTSRD